MNEFGLVRVSPACGSSHIRPGKELSFDKFIGGSMMKL